MNISKRIAGWVLSACGALLIQPAFAQQAIKIGAINPYSYATGFGVKFDKNFQNQRASPTTAQWHSGEMVVAYPKGAAPAGVTLKNLARS